MKILNKILKSDLIEYYIKQRRTMKQIAPILNCSYTTIRRRLFQYNIPIRDKSESQLKYIQQLTKIILYQKYIVEKKGLNQLVKELNCNYATVCRYLRRYNIPVRSIQEAIKLRKNYGRTINTQGYILIYTPNRSYNNKQGYILEHRLVMERYIGRPLKKKEIVHHINGIKGDNRIENLMLFPNRKAHIAFKHLNKKTFICKFCHEDQRISKDLK